MSAIEIKDLCKQFKGKKMVRVDALKGLNLSIAQGEVFGFLGPNGAGKSTTIKLLMGLLRPTSGTARIMNEEVSKADARRQVGYLPENPAFYDYLSAEEYIAFVGAQFKMDSSRFQRKYEEVMKRLDLWDARKRPMRGYSKGMVQRVGLAQALIHDPEVYILDEPMSGLDPIGRALVKDIILDLKDRGKCVFFSTHITSDVETVCDRVGVIVKGEMKCVKRIEDITVGGITGYEVRYLSAGVSANAITRVKKDELATSLLSLQSAGNQVLMVAPVRKNLEEFFVDIVSQG
jgi:ABC-2 type transport system ATP-binding protein